VVLLLLPLSSTMDDGELDHGSGDGSGGNLAAAVAVAVAVVDNDCSNSGRQQEH
jgi:hypothetical protein